MDEAVLAAVARDLAVKFRGYRLIVPVVRSSFPLTPRARAVQRMVRNLVETLQATSLQESEFTQQLTDRRSG